MKMLFLTQYYPPEVGAPQNRLHELALRLKAKGINIDVLTAMPNYPDMKIKEGYKGKWYCTDKIDDISIYRSWIWVSSSKSIISRLLNYFSFVFSSAFVALFKLKKYNVVLCESPPLFLGISALLIKAFKGSKIIFNVSDLWPESAEKLGLVTNKFLLNSATLLEEHLYKTSFLITGQTQGIVKNISQRFPQKKVYWLPNGVDLSFYNPNNIETNWRAENGFKQTDIILIYAGILGYAQGLEVILNAANRVKNLTQVHFVLLGSGPEKQKLLKLKTELQLPNVHFFDVVSKNDMPKILKAVNAHIVPLKKLPLFEGAIPSKIFETLAMKIPVLLGVSGEAKQLFIDEGKAGMYFEPENDAHLANCIVTLTNQPALLNTFAENARIYVAQNFDRNLIAEKFYNVLTQNN